MHLFLFDPSGRLLVQRRSQRRDKFPSTLDCSVSEHLKPGEGYVDAAVRGLREELGIGPVELRRRIHFRMVYGPGDHMVSELYEGSVAPESVTFDPDEVEQIAYYPLGELDVWLERQPDAFSPWFAQLLRWYGGKASQLVAMENGTKVER